MTSIESYVQAGHRQLTGWERHPEIRAILRLGLFLGAGLVLSAAGLRQRPLPVAAGLLWVCSGWELAAAAAGALAGYAFFWGGAGFAGSLWTLCIAVQAAGLSQLRRRPYGLPALLTALTAGAVGLGLELTGRSQGPVWVVLLQTAAGAAAGWVFPGGERDPVLRWGREGMCVLALAQLAPFPWLDLGVSAAAFLWITGSLPAAAFGGLALDLARITPVPMTGAAVLGYLLRLIPGLPRRYLVLGPAVCCLLVMGLTGIWDFRLLPGLLAGSAAGALRAPERRTACRRGEVGAVQVHLEMGAQVLRETGLLLQEAKSLPLDRDALAAEGADRACRGCPCRKHCREQERMGQGWGSLLEQPLSDPGELPVACRKPGRMLAELRRSRERLRLLRADRMRQQEYRQAVEQQYLFAAEFLQGLSDSLSRRTRVKACRCSVQVQVYGSRAQEKNGDRVQKFAGVRGNYYVLLCDGMGTGPRAVQAGKAAGEMLRRMLEAGYPARHALQSLNSLCALREQPGIFTADLAEIQTETGKGVLYKWGASPSYLIDRQRVERLGEAGPPPGLSPAEEAMPGCSFSLGREKYLVMVSDGICPDSALACCRAGVGEGEAMLARKLIGCGRQEGEDDITAVTVRLMPAEY